MNRAAPITATAFLSVAIVLPTVGVAPAEANTNHSGQYSSPRRTLRSGVGSSRRGVLHGRRYLDTRNNRARQPYVNKFNRNWNRAFNSTPRSLSRQNFVYSAPRSGPSHLNGKRGRGIILRGDHSGLKRGSTTHGRSR